MGASEGYSAHDPAETPQDTIERTEKLSIAFEELKTDLLEEVSNVDSKLIRPATDAKVRAHPNVDKGSNAFSRRHSERT